MKNFGWQLWETVVCASLAVFIAGKVTGVLAAWSWWWLLMSVVPTFAYFLGWS